MGNAALGPRTRGGARFVNKQNGGPHESHEMLLVCYWGLFLLSKSMLGFDNFMNGYYTRGYEEMVCSFI